MHGKTQKKKTTHTQLSITSFWITIAFKIFQLILEHGVWTKAAKISNAKRVVLEFFSEVWGSNTDLVPKATFGLMYFSRLFSELSFLLSACYSSTTKTWTDSTGVFGHGREDSQ